MKLTKIFSIILCLAMLLPTLVGCNQTGDTEEITTEAPKAEEPEELFDTKDHFVSFVAYNRETQGLKKFAESTTLSCRFTVPEGYLSQLNVMMGAVGDAQVTLYKWNKDYETTVAGEPIKQVTYLKDELPMYVIAGNCNMELKFEENEIPAGNYLYVVSMVQGSKNNPSIYTGKPWRMNELPEEYAEEYSKYKFAYYENGEKTTFEIPQSSFVFSTQVPHVEVTEEPIPTEKDAEGTAKVIILGGQSNAVGVSRCNILQTKISEEKFEEYTNGYSNVQIMYDNCSGNECFEFVNTALGQGVDTEHFGPELGLAEFLATNFPDEKFYIIKYALGGSVLETQWFNGKKDTPLQLLNGLTELVWDGLEKIEAQGLTPKIIGFIWNQGESDAIYLPRASRYYTNHAGLVNYVRETFAEYASVKGIGFFDVTIAPTLWNAYMSINMQKHEFSKTSPMNFIINVADYPDINALHENNDIAHYDSLAMIKLGQLYGAEIAKILG